MILEIDFDQMSAEMNGKGWFRHRNIIMTLGKEFDRALPLAVQVPTYADHLSRVAFVAKLVAHLSQGAFLPSPTWFIPDPF